MTAITAGQLGTWYRIYSAELLLYARQLTDGANAEDVVQEAFIKLFKQRTCPDDVRAWLYRVVRNGALSWGRSFQRRCRLKVGYKSEQSCWFEWPKDDSLDARRAQDLLAALPRGKREIVVLRIWGQMPLREIAELVKKPVSTVHWAYCDALATLRKQMESSSCQNIA
ncbi:RNA polymerase sigma factor [Planctomycetota bacterium]